jgi:hypothetical protein
VTPPAARQPKLWLAYAQHLRTAVIAIEDARHVAKRLGEDDAVADLGTIQGLLRQEKSGAVDHADHLKRERGGT